MAEAARPATAGPVPRATARRPGLRLAAALLALGAALAAVNLAGSGVTIGALRLFPPADNDLAALRVVYGLLPRVAAALCAGWLLGVSAVLLRQSLRNPLAEAGTLGVFAAARASVAATLVWAPGLAAGFFLPALLGAGLAAGLVLLLSLRSRFEPLRVILNGLVLSLCLDAFSGLMILVHFEEIGELLIWQSGALVQDNWSGVRLLALAAVATGAGVALLRRPLGLLELGDDAMRGLGLPPARLRLIAFVLALVPAALVCAELGILGFVGLAGAALADLSGARRAGAALIAAPLISAGLLLVTDQTALLLSGAIDIPAGVVTALLGAPLLIVLLRRLPPAPPRPAAAPTTTRRRAGPVLALAGLALALAILAGLSVGRLPEGWFLATGSDWAELLPWRWPRLAAAGAAGGMLAFAGCLMQRLTGNALASPELTGVSSGAALLLIPAVLLLPPMGRSEAMALASLGALAMLGLSLRLARRSGFAPETLLLTGVAVSAFAGSVLSVALVLGDPRLAALLGWLSGSTYAVRPADAVLALAMLAAGVALLPFLRRWLALLPLGGAAARSLGVGVARARLALVVLTAVLTATATLIVGPVSFVGLLAPHLARRAGLATPLAEIGGAVLIGAFLLVLADLLARTIAFPWDAPAGLVVTVIGALGYGVIMRRR
ncbi:Fe(3+)-hydroxamate ABC transporter permease FhuB [Ancylobacter sp. IITR112]|uniref:Fe(3+)-hydroxamate ABC transporter permease FhuB n=1 Tax=Ancylobacter sp. IITR112 TaxID=3138073 RepID=UPI00352A0D78